MQLLCRHQVAHFKSVTRLLRGDLPGEFVPDDHRPCPTGIDLIAIFIHLDEMEIGPSDTAGANSDQHIFGADFWVRYLFHFKAGVPPDIGAPASDTSLDLLPQEVGRDQTPSKTSAFWSLHLFRSE
jgi:hypothetical protein